MENNANYKEKIRIYRVDNYSIGTISEKINTLLNDGWKVKNQTFSGFSSNSDTCLLSVVFYCDKFIDLTKKQDVPA